MNKIHASITDFPVFSTLETFFREFRKADVDGVELVLGAKSRWNGKQVRNLSKEYQLPIGSVHQPAWSGVGLYFDERFVEFALSAGTNKIVCHPLAFHTFESRAMGKYFEKLAKLQEKYGVHVMLENMPNDIAYYKLHQFTKDPMRSHMQKISDIADEYGFLTTYDVSHTEYKKPQDEKVFQDVLPKLGNIHLSSFRQNKHHLPLNMGFLDSEGFLKYLFQKKYKGLVTLEVFYPRIGMMLGKYSFAAVRNSVNVFRKIVGKLS